jgi:hypothetical protein
VHLAFYIIALLIKEQAQSGNQNPPNKGQDALKQCKQNIFKKKAKACISRHLQHMFFVTS